MKYGTSYQNKMKKWICNLTFDTKYAHGGKQIMGSLGKLWKQVIWIYLQIKSPL